MGISSRLFTYDRLDNVLCLARLRSVRHDSTNAVCTFLAFLPMKTYKYALAITSQLPFCSVPLRLDTYNQCQFSCAFCFAKARGGNSTPTGIQSASITALKKRLARACRGDTRSALDEFIQRRIPIQLGGMNDPFSPWERQHRISLQALRVLADYDYPTLISTKSAFLDDPEYLSVLKSGNFYVRQSLTALAEPELYKIEKGLPSTAERLKLTEKLSNSNIAVSIRLQPIFWGHEEHASHLIERSALAGAKQVTAEYLKWPIETTSHEYARLAAELPKLKEFYLSNAASRVGREYVLPSALKLPRLMELKSLTETRGMVFGFADNEFLHMNSFRACCNASDYFLRDANYFETTILGIIKSAKPAKELRFPSQIQSWMPEHSIFSHLNSRSRPETGNLDNKQRLVSFLRDRWNSQSWRNGPASYWGVETKGRVDEDGNRIFYRSSEPITPRSVMTV